MIKYFLLSSLVCTSFSLFSLADFHWKAIVDYVTTNGDKNSEIDREVAITAFRNISSRSQGFVNLASDTITAAFPGIIVPKRFAELSEAELKRETQDTLTKPQAQGG